MSANEAIFLPSLGLSHKQLAAILGFLLKEQGETLGKMLQHQEVAGHIRETRTRMEENRKAYDAERYDAIRESLMIEHDRQEAIREAYANRSDALIDLTEHMTGEPFHMTRMRVAALLAADEADRAEKEGKAFPYQVLSHHGAMSPGGIIAKGVMAGSAKRAVEIIADSLYARYDTTRTEDKRTNMDRLQDIADEQARINGPVVTAMLDMAARANEELTGAEIEALQKAPDEAERQRLERLHPGLGDFVMGDEYGDDRGKVAQAHPAEADPAHTRIARRFGTMPESLDMSAAAQLAREEAMHPSQEVGPTGVGNPRGKMTQAQIEQARREGKL